MIPHQSMESSNFNEIVNSDTRRQPSGAALPCEGELSRLRSGGTPASLLSSRHLSCRSIRGLGLLDERAEDLPEDSPSITVRKAAITGLESIKEGKEIGWLCTSEPLGRYKTLYLSKVHCNIKMPFTEDEGRSLSISLLPLD